MKIGFTVDTNMIKDISNKVTSIERSIKLYLDYIKVQSKMEKDNTLTFYLSDVVKQEIICQNRKTMETDYNHLMEAYDNAKYFLSSEIPSNKMDEMIKDEEKFAESLNLLKLDVTAEKFQKVIDSAMNKKTPFAKKDGDAGFKDCLIWETILDAKEIDECDKFYYFTTDKDFKKDNDSLEKQFQEKHPTVELFIKLEEPNGEQRQKALSYIINENHLLKTDIVTLYDESKLLEHINKLKDEEIDVLDANGEVDKVIIKPSEFSKIDISIDDVKEDSGQFTITLNINTMKYNSTPLFSLHGKMILILRKNNKSFVHVNHEFKDMKYYKSFYTNYMDRINRINRINRIASSLTMASSKLEELNNQLQISGLSEALETLSNQLKLYNEPMKEVIDKINESQEPFRKLESQMKAITSSIEWIATNQLSESVRNSFPIYEPPTIIKKADEYSKKKNDLSNKE